METPFLGGRFRVVGLLGKGGMGIVYKVLNEATKAHCAFKQILPGKATSADVLARFRREAEASGLIKNPHIVKTYDAATLPSGEPYVLMELLEGETLASRITRNTQLDLRDICHLMAQACEGVQAAHVAGIIHRDLKPANLFITDMEGEPFVKLLDFGIAKFDVDLTDGEDLTRGGPPLGTPCYMSPEQIRGDAHMDGRSDVYTLGVILYECAAGKVPFRWDSPKLQWLIQEGKPAPLRNVRPGLPEAFYRLVAAAMATETHRRPATAAELGDALRRIAHELPVENGTVTLRDNAPPQVTSDIPDIVGKTGALERLGGTATSLDGLTLGQKPSAPTLESGDPVGPSRGPKSRPSSERHRPLGYVLAGVLMGILVVGAGREIATGPSGADADTSSTPATTADSLTTSTSATTADSLTTSTPGENTSGTAATTAAPSEAPPPTATLPPKNNVWSKPPKLPESDPPKPPANATPAAQPPSIGTTPTVPATTTAPASVAPAPNPAVNPQRESVNDGLVQPRTTANQK